MGLLPEQRPSNDRFSIHELVVTAVSKFQIPASDVWGMTVADILLSLREPEAKGGMVTNALEQRLACLQADRRWELLDKLTLDQRVELAQWKAELM